MNDVDKNWTLITGANSGIGRATTELLANNNYQILATARKSEDIEELKQINNVTALYLDLTEPESITELIKYIEDHNLTIGTLVNNAGILYMDLLATMPITQVRQLCETNILGVVQLSQAIIPYLIGSKGRIINISSDSGLVTFPYTIAYSMTKYAIEAMSDGLRTELSRYDIDVVIVEPGNVETTITQKAWQSWQDTDIIEHQTREDNNIMKPLYQQRKSIRDILKKSQDLAGITPEDVAEIIMEAIEDDNPKPRYFVGDKEELNYVINELIEQVVQINASSKHRLNDDELREKLEFALNIRN